MTLKNAIWDYDGTLADTYAGILNSLVATLRHFGCTEIDEKQLYRTIKLTSVTKVLKECAVEQKQDFLTIQKYYQVLDHQAQEKVDLYPQAAAILQRITQMGGHNYLLTHRDQQTVQLLERQGIAAYFDQVITASDDFPRKPDPTALNAIVNQYDLDKEQTAMIGDRSLDILAGKNAHVKTIYFDVDDLHDSAQADFVVSELAQIEPLFS